MPQTAIIIGASSGLGKALSELLAAQNCNLILSSRNVGELSALANELETKHNIKTKVLPIDLSRIERDEAIKFVENCFEWSPAINQVYVTAAIVMNEDDEGDKSADVLRKLFETNFMGISIIVAELAKWLSNSEANISVISSVAAIRARDKNAAYSASKIALEYFITGLNHFYSNKQLHLQLYRIGYMDTNMIKGTKTLLPPASPHRVAKYIVRNRKSKFEVRYYPLYWKWIAVVLANIPWFIYKKIKF